MGGNPSRVRISGPLVPYFDGFRAELEHQGYRRHESSKRPFEHPGRTRSPRGSCSQPEPSAWTGC